jgi:hypothetical protein
MKVSYEVAAPPRFDEGLLRAMCRLRRTFVDLKPGVDPEDDFRGFAGFFRAASHGVLFRDGAGRLVGFFGVALPTREAEGQRYVAMVMEYLFMEEAYHGHPALLWARADVSLRVLLHKPWLPRYAVTLSYPASAMAFHAAYPGIVTLGQEGLTPFQRAALEEQARAAGGDRWDPRSPVVPMNTLPRTPPRLPRSPANRAAYAAFVRLNPRWHEGYCSVLMAPFGLATIVEPLRRALRR